MPVQIIVPGHPNLAEQQGIALHAAAARAVSTMPVRLNVLGHPNLAEQQEIAPHAAATRVALIMHVRIIVLEHHSLAGRQETVLIATPTKPVITARVVVHIRCVQRCVAVRGSIAAPVEIRRSVIQIPVQAVHKIKGTDTFNV